MWILSFVIILQSRDKRARHTRPRLRRNVQYALMEDQPDHELFQLKSRYYIVEWDSKQLEVSSNNSTPICIERVIANDKNCHQATRVFFGREIGGLFMG